MKQSVLLDICNLDARDGLVDNINEGIDIRTPASTDVELISVWKLAFDDMLDVPLMSDA